MTGTDIPRAAPSEDEEPRTTPPSSRTSRILGLAVGGAVLFIATVTVVLMVALGVLGSNGLPTAAAQRALLTASDLKKISGVSIATDGNSAVRMRTLRAYVKANPGDTSHTVTPARCADNLQGWLAWKSLDTPSYKGWKTDTIYEANNIVIDSAKDFENGLQEARHFATVGQATAFMSAQRGWYATCAKTRYVDPQDPSDNSAFSFSPVPLNLGLDSVVEGATVTGQDLPPHLVDVYLRNANIVYVTELVTTTSPKHGLDPVSLAIVTTAANKLRTLR